MFLRLGMAPQINRVLIFANKRYQIWAYRTYMYTIMTNGMIDKRSYDHVDDLFELPLKGLLKLVGEYIVDVERSFYNNDETRNYEGRS